MNKIKIFKILFGIDKCIYFKFMALSSSKDIYFPILVSFKTRIKGISKHTLKLIKSNGCIVRYGSLVNKIYSYENNIIVVVPKKVVKSNIYWRH